MTRIAFLTSITSLGFAFFVVPGFAVAKFECRKAKFSTPATLEENKSQLPDREAMADVGRLTATINILRQKGMPGNQIVDYLVGTCRPMVAQESSSSETKKYQVFGASLARLPTYLATSKASWTLLSMYRSQVTSWTRSTQRQANKASQAPLGSL